MRTNEDHEMRTRAVFPGTFDPFTAGHLSLAERGHGLFDELVIAVFDNSAKNPRMKKDERLALIRRATAHLPGIRGGPGSSGRLVPGPQHLLYSPGTSEYAAI